MPAQTKTLVKSSTQNHLDIADVQDDLIILKDGTCCLVLKTTAVNFGLLSEREQEATIHAYAGLLNSLTFSVQILIHSRQKDISSYLDLINEQLKKQTDEKLRSQTEKYRQFIENTVKKNKVLDKKFYLIISYFSIGFRKGAIRKIIEKTKTNLYPKRDHLVGQFQRLGLKTSQLNNQELIEFLYNLYNPEAEGQKFVLPAEYATPLVQPVSQPKALTQPQPQPPPMAPVQKPGPPPPPAAAPAPKDKVFSSPTNPSMAKPVNTLLPQKPSSQTTVLQGQDLQKHINKIVQKVKKQPT